MKGGIGFSKLGKGFLLSGALFSLSIASHAALLALPLPASRESFSFFSPEVEAKGEMAVVMLPPPQLAEASLDAPPEDLPVNAIAPSVVEVSAAPSSPEVPQAIPVPPVPPVPVPTVSDDPEAVLADPLLEASEPEDVLATVNPPEVEANSPITPSPSEPESLVVEVDPPGPLRAYGTGFPHFEGATAGCFGTTGCRRVSGVGSYREVARSLIANLETQGYQVRLRDDLEDTGRNVYELTPPGSAAAAQYLIVFSDPSDGSAVYVMSDEVLTLHDLESL